MSKEMDHKLFAFKMAITKELRALRNDLPVNKDRKVIEKTISQEHLEYMSMSPDLKKATSLYDDNARDLDL